MIAEDTITLVGLQGAELRTLSRNAEWTFDQRSDSTNQLTVTVATEEATDVVGDMELLFQHRRFVINEVNRTRDDETCEIVADEAQAEMASIEVESFQVEKLKLSAAVSQLLANTLWTVGTIEDDSRTIYADLQGKKVTELLSWLANQSNQVLQFDSARRKVSFVKQDLTPSGVVFNYDVNLSNIKKTETPPTCTVLHPIGANGLTVSNVNHGSELVEDFGWYTSLGMTEDEARARFTKRQEWKDERYTVVQNLLDDAKKKLAVSAYPTLSYDLTAVDDIAGLTLGRQAYVWDNVLNVRVLTTVSVIHTSSVHDDDSVTLDYVPPSFTIATDDTTGDSSDTTEASVFQAFNDSDYTLGDTATRVLPLSIDVYADTMLQCNLCLTVKTTTAGLLEGYFLLNGEKAGPRIMQTCEVGYVTLGLPFLITNVSSNDQTTLDLYLKHGGAGSLATNDAQIYITAKGAYGGITNERPDRRVVDAVERFKREWRSVADSANVLFPERNDTNVSESVERFKTEWRNVEDVVNPLVWLEDTVLTIRNAIDGTVYTLTLPDKSVQNMPAVANGSTSFDLNTLGLSGRVKIMINELNVSVTVSL